jgi:hypothetical protein
MSRATDLEGAQLVATLESTFRKYVALDSGLPFVLALWTLATHVFDCFDAFPYLAITSPTKRCGKTRLAEIIDLLCCNGLRTAGASTAAIFRTIQSQDSKSGTVTLILDEAEMLGTKSERSEQLREILNAGYRRGQYVLRCERTSDEGFEPARFKVYCPKVLVLIGNLHDTLADRSIPIAMRRRKASELVGRFFYSQAEREARRFRKEVERWAESSRRKVKRCSRQDLEFVEDREAELWLPLFAVCRAVAPDRLKELTGIAIRISHGKHEEEPADFGVLILRDIRAAFIQSGKELLPSTNLIMELNLVEESPWPGWSHGKGLDARSLARLLRPFRIVPHNLRVENDMVLKGYERADFEEACSMYLPRDSSATTLQANTGAGSSEFLLRYTDENVAARKCEIANGNGACSAVAVPEGEEAQNQGGFTGELIPPMPPGTVLASWELKPAPVTIGPGETVTDPAKFARGCLEQLRNALANPRRRAAWTVPQLIERLALVGVMVTTNK